MIERYSNAQIASIFCDENKVGRWQDTELAVIHALADIKTIEWDVYSQIKKIWEKTPVDIPWWLARDKEIHHDLNAFIDERVRHLPSGLQQYVHKKITSFDTEEPAFHVMILEACDVIYETYKTLEALLMALARKHRYTIMMARTHGQEAELQTFGARVLTWITDLRMAYAAFETAYIRFRESKISGAIGKYGSIAPELEERALQYMGLTPFYGATQIIPRIIHAPLAQAISNLVSVIDKMAGDIRLSARSGRPLLQEPFGKKQKGSSAMPHKKNTIGTEQLEGMARMARGYAAMISENIKTWEERAIEQSCVERVAWPDLFHICAHSIKTLTKVIHGLRVYPDNMLEEVYLSRGVYASSEVKEFLKERLAPMGASYEDAYRIVQLACFNVFAPDWKRQEIRDRICENFTEAFFVLDQVEEMKSNEEVVSIQRFIPSACLQESDSLDIDHDMVIRYNRYLEEIFKDNDNQVEWNRLFMPEFLLKNESKLFFEILGDNESDNFEEVK